MKCWVQLVDSEGKEYQGSKASRVTVDDNAIIDDLRVAVKDANPQIPATVGTSQLRIFASRQAFENKEELVNPRIQVNPELEYLVEVPDKHLSNTQAGLEDNISMAVDTRLAPINKTVMDLKEDTLAAQVAINKTVMDLKEQFSNYIQKAETMQISNMNFDALKRDGFKISPEVIAKEEFDDSQIRKFEWKNPNSEASKENKELYTQFINDCFQKSCIVSAIPSPGCLNVSEGLSHHLKGTADVIFYSPWTMPPRVRFNIFHSHNF